MHYLSILLHFLYVLVNYWLTNKTGTSLEICDGDEKPSGLRYYSFIHSFISFIQAISLAPLQVHYYSEALPTQHRYYV